MNRKSTCCFTGHRKLSEDVMGKIIIRLDHEVESLINQGVINFISGGALGFDQLAASLVIAKKEMGRDIRLIFALSCKNQDELWNRKQKKLYRNLLAEADKVIYISEEYHEGCMKKRNQYMIDHSAFCICALLPPFYGTDPTVKYARQQG
jgi:uncharacterized phage-like protein YoqJ